NEAERMRQLPAGEGIGRKAGVDQRKSGNGALIAEVCIIMTYLVSGQLAFIYNGPGRQGSEIDLRFVFRDRVAYRFGNIITQHEQLALEFVLVGDLVRA